MVNLFLSNFRDPGIIPRGNLEKLEFEKNDQELNLYGNFIDPEITSTDEEFSLTDQTSDERKNERKPVAQIY